jgi:hypothetical protein
MHHATASFIELVDAAQARHENVASHRISVQFSPQRSVEGIVFFERLFRREFRFAFHASELVVGHDLRPFFINARLRRPLRHCCKRQGSSVGLFRPDSAGATG